MICQIDTPAARATTSSRRRFSETSAKSDANRTMKGKACSMKAGTRKAEIATTEPNGMSS